MYHGQEMPQDDEIY